ncbi:MAG: HEAT repeat domain-containing protein [Planctomycetes bacterium]|nr:HEAT repeat domain-containing protein [Planctomycetota bacterium]
MDEPSSEADRALRMQIAQEAADKTPVGTIFTRSLQFFLVPLLIVLSCVGIYLFFTYLVGGRQTPREWVQELKEGGPLARKHAAAQLVAELRRQVHEDRRDPALVAPIIDVFTSLKGTDAESRQTRALVARCLGLLGDTRGTPVLLEALRTEDVAEAKAAYIDAIGALRDPEAAPDLVKLLDHPSSIVRKYATFTLGALAVPEAVEPLKGRLGDERPEVQWNAAFVLAFYLRDASGAPILRRMLDRAYITQIVTSGFKEPGGIGEATAANAPALIAYALQMGCQGIAALGDAASVGALESLAAGDPDIGVRDAAMKTLRVIEKR